MNQFNFWNYSEKAEEDDYIQFVNADLDQIMQWTKGEQRIDFFPDYMVKIIKQLKNVELKQKMIQKMKELFNDERYTEKYPDYVQNLDLEIFTEQEAKEIIDIEIGKRHNSNQYDSWISKRDEIDCILSLNIPDFKWQVDRINNVLNISETNEAISIDQLNLILYIKDTEIADFFIQKYKQRFPEEYKKYIEIQNDRNYVQKKAEQYKDVRIGIDPNMKVAAEIEADNEMNIFFNVGEQEGIQDYISKRDATVPKGIEVNTSILHDTPEEISKFCAVCETMKEQGYFYDNEQENAAGQINLGIDYLDSARAILNFVEIFCNSEELLFHIANPEGQLIRQEVYVNSKFKAVSERIGARIVEEDISRDVVIQMLTASGEPRI